MYIVLYLLVFAILVNSIRQIYIYYLINQVPNHIRKLKLPHPGNLEKLKDRDDRIYISLNKQLESEKKETIIKGLPYVSNNTINWRCIFGFENGKNIISIDPLYFDKELKLGDKITGIQLRINTGNHQWLGEPSGKRKYCIPFNLDIDPNDFSIELANQGVDKTYLVKRGLKIRDTDWPFGKPGVNDWGPIINFDDNDFTYLGKNLVIIIKHSSPIKTYFDVTKTNLCKTTYSNQNKFNDYNACLDIRLEIDRN